MTQEANSIRTDRMRFTQDSLSANLILVAIVMDALYFVSVYQSNVSTWYYNWVMGASIICNLLFLLMAFLASEGVKSRKTGFTLPLIGLGVFQVIRIFYLPALAHTSTVVIAGQEIMVMDDGQYMYCIVVAAVISEMNNRKLAAHMKSLETHSA